jgi:hypothetical protein
MASGGVCFARVTSARVCAPCSGAHKRCSRVVRVAGVAPRVTAFPRDNSAGTQPLHGTLGQPLAITCTHAEMCNKAARVGSDAARAATQRAHLSVWCTRYRGGGRVKPMACNHVLSCSAIALCASHSVHGTHAICCTHRDICLTAASLHGPDAFAE